MKNYKKVKMVAKNAPSGSYAAGCPEKYALGEPNWCRKCDRAS